MGKIKGGQLSGVAGNMVFYNYNDTFYIFTSSMSQMERIFAKSTLRAFWEKYPDSEQYLKIWYETAMNSDWGTPNEVKGTYGSASILKDNRNEH